MILREGGCLYCKNKRGACFSSSAFVLVSCLIERQQRCQILPIKINITRSKHYTSAAISLIIFRREWDCSLGLAPAITTAATFVMSGPEEIQGQPLYGRYGNPSRNSVEAILASLEGAKHAMCFSSGWSQKMAKLCALWQWIILPLFCAWR